MQPNDELRLLLRRTAATALHVRTVDIVLDADDRPVVLRDRARLNINGRRTKGSRC